MFLDEITALPSFEQELKNLYDLENVKVYASSSSASLLKSKNSALVGRSRIVEVLPLDFDEFLLFKNKVVKKMNSISSKRMLKIFFAWEDFQSMFLQKMRRT